MDKTLTLYHGSSLIIERPQFGKGNPFNDYGLGFYCTETLELAKEWACSMEQDGFANRYSFRTDGLSVLNLSDGNYNILNWLAILLMNTFAPLIDHCVIECSIKRQNKKVRIA